MNITWHTFKEKPTTFRKGQWFRLINKPGVLLMLCQVGYFKVQLIDIQSGDRWHAMASVQSLNAITVEEMKIVAGNECHPYLVPVNVNINAEDEYSNVVKTS